MPLPLTHKNSLPVPDDLPRRQVLDLLKEGCYLLNLVTQNPLPPAGVQLCGTLRVERLSSSPQRAAFRMSADLYNAPPPPVLPPAIPVFPRGQYNMYWTLSPEENTLRFVSVGDGNRLQIAFRTAVHNQKDWVSRPVLRVQLNPLQLSDPPRYDVVVHDGPDVFAVGTAVWLSADFRSLTVRPAGVAGVPIPVDNGGEVSWTSLFRAARWQVRVLPPESVAHPAGRDVWTLAELHSILAKLTPSAQSLDEDWCVTLLCVEQIFAFEDSLRGVMFDFGEIDSDGVPRQASAIAARWRVPNNPSWRAGSRTTFCEFLTLYFRTAIHEVGHALSMQHPDVAGIQHVMSATNDLIGQPDFPDGLATQMSQEELVWLCHQPDPVVRPGGLPYPAGANSLDQSSLKLRSNSSVRLHVSPLLPVFPIGAPVRLHIAVVNNGRRTALIPRNLGFSQGKLRILLEGPDGVCRAVNGAVSACEDCPWQRLDPSLTWQSGVTLLRNSTGPLFPIAGEYKLHLQIPVRQGRQQRVLLGVGHVTVQSALNPRHERLANRAINSVGLQQALVLGGNISASTARLMAALLDDPILRPHFAYIEAKRVSMRYFRRRGNLRSMASLLQPSAVMTCQEVSRAIDLVRQTILDGSRASVSLTTIRRALRSRLQRMQLQPEQRTRLLYKLRGLQKRSIEVYRKAVRAGITENQTSADVEGREAPT